MVILTPVGDDPLEAVGPIYQVLLAQLKALKLKREGLALGLWGEPGIGKSHTVRELLRGVPYRSNEEMSQFGNTPKGLEPP